MELAIGARHVRMQHLNAKAAAQAKDIADYMAASGAEVKILAVAVLSAA